MCWNSYLGMIQRIVVLREAVTEFVKWYAETGGPSRPRNVGEDSDEVDDLKNWEFSVTDWIDLKFL